MKVDMSHTPETWPSREWDSIPIPINLRQSVSSIQADAQRIKSYALFAIMGGRVAFEHGSVDTAVGMQSVRKALMNALIGRAVADGMIDLSSTMAELGVDDIGGLTQQEASATVRDCLMGRSGVYHAAAYEPLGLDARRPDRDSHAPGEFWFYNNWDFNVLATVFNNAVGVDVFTAFNRWFAEPLQMQDFEPSYCSYFREPVSNHPAYLFAMSARDLGRFALLYLRLGQWRGLRLLSEDWITDSLSPHSQATHGYEAFTKSFGLLWWVAREDLLGGHRSYAALGGSGHGMFVIPDLDAVIVHRNLDEATEPNWPQILPVLEQTVDLCEQLAK